MSGGGERGRGKNQEKKTRPVLRDLELCWSKPGRSGPPMEDKGGKKSRHDVLGVHLRSHRA